MAENGIDEIVMLSDRAEDVSKAGEVLEHLYGKLRRCMKRDNFRCVPFPPCIHGTCQIRNAPHNPDPVMRGTGKEFYCACPTGFEGFTCERGKIEVTLKFSPSIELNLGDFYMLIDVSYSNSSKQRI